MRELYGYKCAVCGEHANEVHHIIPIQIDESLSLDNSNLILLCSKCHKFAHLGIYSQAELLKLKGV